MTIFFTSFIHFYADWSAPRGKGSCYMRLPALTGRFPVTLLAGATRTKCGPARVQQLDVFGGGLDPNASFPPLAIYRQVDLASLPGLQSPPCSRCRRRPWLPRRAPSHRLGAEDRLVALRGRTGPHRLADRDVSPAAQHHARRKEHSRARQQRDRRPSRPQVTSALPRTSPSRAQHAARVFAPDTAIAVIRGRAPAGKVCL